LYTLSRGFEEVLVEKYGGDIILDKSIFTPSLLIVIFPFLFFPLLICFNLKYEVLHPTK
jgi:hypothetical protein